MVAYSFAPMFAEPVATLIKRQTIRADRKRHARPGEALQLYAGMRTKHCRKLVDRDPVCTSVQAITLATSPLVDAGVVSIAIEGRVLNRAEIEEFALLDGFAPATFNAIAGTAHATARANMGWFWIKNHGVGRFDGVLINWEPR